MNIDIEGIKDKLSEITFRNYLIKSGLTYFNSVSTLPPKARHLPLKLLFMNYETKEIVRLKKVTLKDLRLNKKGIETYYFEANSTKVTARDYDYGKTWVILK